jgi:hypothetical protein
LLCIALAVLVVLDVLYLMYAWLTFGDPCKVAKETRLALANNPRDLKGQPAPGFDVAKGLPKIIHQQWKSKDIPSGEYSEYHARFKELFPEPEYTHMLWTDESARALIMEHFPWFLEAYDGYYLNIQRADATRYFVLYFHGGVYSDLDYEPFVNFWSELPTDRVSLIESPYKSNEMVQNSLMSSPQRDPFWNITFQVLYERRNSKKVLSSTGPSAMDAAIGRIPDKTWVHMLPCENFHRIPTGKAGANAPWISRLARAFLAYTPLSKTCGDWTRRDDCHLGLHHNSVSYMGTNKGGSILDFTNF